MKTINSTLEDQALVDDVLREVFEMWWPRLDEKITLIMRRFEEDGGVRVGSRRPDREMLEEVLLLTRRLSSGSFVRSRRPRINPGAYDQLVSVCVSLVESPLIMRFSGNDIRSLLDVAHYIISRSEISEEMRDSFIERLTMLMTLVSDNQPTIESDTDESQEQGEN